MDNKQAEKTYKELVDRYGSELPNYVHEPRRFQHYVNIYSWNKQLEKLAVDSKPKE